MIATATEQVSNGYHKTIFKTNNPDILHVNGISQYEVDMMRMIENASKSKAFKIPKIYETGDNTALVEAVHFDYQFKVIHNKLYPFIYNPQSWSFTEKTMQSLPNINNEQLILQIIEATIDFQHLLRTLKLVCQEYEILVVTKSPTQFEFYMIDFGLCSSEEDQEYESIEQKMMLHDTPLNRGMYSDLIITRNKLLDRIITQDEYNTKRTFDPRLLTEEGIGESIWETMNIPSEYL